MLASHYGKGGIMDSAKQTYKGMLLMDRTLPTTNNKHCFLHV